MSCRVCAGVTRVAFAHRVLAKYDCAYHYCAACGLLQTDEPHWLAEAYAHAIADADTGLVQRNLTIAEQLAALIAFAFDRRGTYVDFAGGYGLLTRLMRDRGFDFYWADRYCENLLARGFEAPAAATFTAATAFEVLEHVHDPLAFIRDALARTSTRTLIFSTELFSGTPPAPDRWPYYAFETGTHISFYQRRTLDELARRLGLRAYSNKAFHMLTDVPVSPIAFRALTTSRIARVLARAVRLPSRTLADHVAILRRPR